MTNDNTPTKQELDDEHTMSVTYELVIVAPHAQITPENRAIVRRAFENSVQLMRTSLLMAADGLSVQLRATRHSAGHGRLDMTDAAEYPQEDEDDA